MRRVFLVLGVATALALLVLFWTRWGVVSAPHAPADPPPASGMALIDSFQCLPGQTRHVVVRGVEDNFSPAGREPAPMPPRAAPGQLLAVSTLADYDSPRANRVIFDWFDLPASTVGGLVVTRLRPLGDNLNDTLTMGENRDGDLRSARDHVSLPIATLEAQPGWRRSGDLFWGDMTEMRLMSGVRLINWIRSASGHRNLDVTINDDTSVDFIAIAWCQSPDRRMGMTWAKIDDGRTPTPGLVAFDCLPSEGRAGACGYVTGDQPCDRPLPLLCFHDLDLPPPKKAVAIRDLLSRRWSGGEVAGSAPVRGDRFSSVSQADAYCAASFGKDWRVAEWHDGGSGHGFGALSGGRAFPDRYWVDIHGMPYATCWAHDDDQ